MNPSHSDREVARALKEYVEFEIQRYVTRRPLDRLRLARLAEVSITREMDLVGGALVAGLQAELARRLLARTEIKYPDGPWEAWKDRYAPKWFTRRFPVKWVRVSVHAHEYLHATRFPESGIYLERQQTGGGS